MPVLLAGFEISLMIYVAGFLKGVVGMYFEQALERVLKHEGGYSHHPQDPGGETRWGISAAVARRHGYRGAMQDLELELAKRIYRQDYWQPLACAELPPGLAFQLFDAGVNHGPGTAMRVLQQCAGVAVDGLWGPLTRAAVLAEPAFELMIMMNVARMERYIALPGFVHFGRGWIARLVQNMRYAREDACLNY